MSAIGESSSAALRKLGNGLYKQNKLDEAVIQYKLAAESEKSDPAPLSNLSATYFELGNYNTSIEVTLKALHLAQPDDVERKQKLNIRLAKCYIHLRQYGMARATVEAIKPSTDREILTKSLAHVSSADSSESDIDSARAKVINSMPRYKPALQQVPEYYTVGHDIPTPLVDPDMFKNCIKRNNKVSLFFGGIGDARNMYATLLDIIVFDSNQPKLKVMPMIRITINDLKAPAIARDLVVMFILHEVADSLSNGPAQQALVALYYVYLSPIMPPDIYAVLQVRISRVINALEGKANFPLWLDVPEMYRPCLLQALRAWQTETATAYPASRLREVAVHSLMVDRMRHEMRIGAHAAFPKGRGVYDSDRCCPIEEEFYFKTGVLVVLQSEGEQQTRLDMTHTTEIDQSLQEFRVSNGSSSIPRETLQNIDQFWKPNPTMIDLEWERNRDEDSRFPGGKTDPDVCHNPFDFIEALEKMGLKAESGFLRFQLFFYMVACAIHDLKGRLRIEAIPGDVTKVLEQVRYGLVGHRKAMDATPGATDKRITKRQQIPSSSEYPHMYDRIHLSNIPDYIGGTLSSFLYAMPVTIVGDDAYVTATCLRNPPKFRSMSHFNNEYLGISSASDLESVFQTRLGEHDGVDFMPLASYANWHHSQTKALPFSNLMPRARLESWLYRMFMKIAIPVPRQIIDMQLVYSPLNLTVLFRLVQHLSEAGYPSHWLSQVLANIISGTITTNTRPPKSNPLKLREVKEESRNTCLTQSTGPFVAEMLTLASVWSSFVPFGLVGCQISSTRDVKKYEVNFRQTKNGGQGIIACFVLVFVDDRIFKSLPASKRSNMRQLLLPDETGAQGAAEKTLRQNGMHVVSTWEWSRESKNATFWMLSGIASEMRDQWSVRMIRTDDWSVSSETVLLREGLVDTGESWST